MGYRGPVPSGNTNSIQTANSVLAYAGVLNGGGSGTELPVGMSRGGPTTRTQRSGKGPLLTGFRGPKQVPLYYGRDADAPGGWDPAQRDQLLQTLVQVGLLNPKQYRPGQWDTNAKAAFEILLGQANREGAPWGRTLDEQIALAEQGLLGPKSSSRQNPPLTITKTSATDIKAAFDKKAPDLLGRTLQPDEISPFVAGFNDLEVQAQTQQYNQQYSAGGGYGAGGTTVAPPDKDAYAAQAIKDKYKQEVTGNTLGQNALEFLKLLTGSASGTPSGTGLPGHQT